MKKIYYFTNYFPFYRKAIWELLVNENKYDFHIFYSKKERQGIKQHHKINEDKLHGIKNIFFKQYLIWQFGIFKKILFNSPDIIIFIGELNILSTWIGVLICKLKSKKVWFWGHGIYGNERFFKKFVRLLFLNLADKNLVYEKRSKNLLIQNGFDPSKIEIIYNSLNYTIQEKYYKKFLKTHTDLDIFKTKNPIILFFGRLTHNKKVNLLLEAVKIIQETLAVNLLILGDGEARESLEKEASELNLKSTIFYGASYDENKIANIFLGSKLCVSPGNVGLTAIHSISYGTPIISHNNLYNQMPEAEVIKEGINGYLFDENNVLSLVNAVKKGLNDKTERHIVRETIKKNYNPNSQKYLFDKLILNG